MKKIVVSMLLATSLAACSNGSNHSVTADSDSKTTPSCFTTEANANGLVITGYTKPLTTLCSANVVIPSELDGKPVVAIADNAFADHGLTSVLIPSGVTTIGANAFSNNNLVAIEIPAGVVSVGDGAFKSNLINNIYINEGLKSLGNDVFASQNIADNSLVITTNAKTPPVLGSNAFGNVEKINETVVPVGTNYTEWNKEIGGMDKIVFNRSAVECFKTTNSADGLVITGYTKPLTSECSSDISIPSLIGGKTVVAIADNAFADHGLTSVKISQEIKTIGANAFANNQLEAVTIPGTVTTIGANAFTQNKINYIKLSEGTKSIGADAFAAQNIAPATLMINSTATTPAALGANAFGNNTLINKVLIPDEHKGNYQEWSTQLADKVMDIKPSNTAFTSEEVAGGVKITSYDWNTDPNFPNIIIPETINGKPVVAIGEKAFWDFGEIEYVSIPSTVTSIEASAFSANVIKSIQLPANLRFLGENVFLSNRITSVTIPDKLRVIPDGAFELNSGLTEVNLGVSVAEIVEYAFGNHDSKLTINVKNPLPAKLVGKEQFGTLEEVEVIHVPAGTKAQFDVAWSAYASKIVEQK